MQRAHSPIPRHASAAASPTRDVTTIASRDTEEEETWYPRMPRSAIPLQKTRAVDRVYRPPQTRVTEVEPDRRGISIRRFFLIVLLVILVGMFIAYLLNTIILPGIANWQDNATYGYPRITKATADVGHGDKNHPLSQFIA